MLRLGCNMQLRSFEDAVQQVELVKAFDVFTLLEAINNLELRLRAVVSGAARRA